MLFRKAESNEIEKVLDLYDNARQSELCVWNDVYPTIEDAQHDFDTGNLYVLSEDNTVIAALSVVPENEMDEFDCWKVKNKFVREIARIVVKDIFQGNGYAAGMVENIIEILRQSDCTAIHLSVADINTPAYKTYSKVGFEVVGETDMYGNHYYLFEKIL